MNNIPTSYLLWLCWLAGFSGLHRIYNKKFATGLLWFFTWGLFGVGQIIDIFLIPNMVDEHNLKVRNRLGLSSNGVPLTAYNPQPTQTYNPSKSPSEIQPFKPLSTQEIMIILAKTAAKRGGKLSITQAVIDTGITFEEVETTLNEMVTKGYIMIDNHPENGSIVYEFTELS